MRVSHSAEQPSNSNILVKSNQITKKKLGYYSSFIMCSWFIKTRGRKFSCYFPLKHYKYILDILLNIRQFNSVYGRLYTRNIIVQYIMLNSNSTATVHKCTNMYSTIPAVSRVRLFKESFWFYFQPSSFSIQLKTCNASQEIVNPMYSITFYIWQYWIQFTVNILY